MKIALMEMDGLAQRLEILRVSESAESSNASVSFTREAHTPPSTTSSRVSPLRPGSTSLEINSERQSKFALIETNTAALRALRAQRLQLITDEAEARAKSLELERQRKRQEEERQQKERERKRQEEEKLEQEKREAEKKAQEKREADEREAREKDAREKLNREAAAKAAADRAAEAKEAEEKAKIEAESLKKQQEEEALKQQQQQQAEQAKQAAQAQQAKEALSRPTAEYEEHMAVIQSAKEMNTQMSSNKQLKKQCFELKIKLKSKLGQLTPSRAHLWESVNIIKDIFAQAQNTGDLGFEWTLNQYSKILVQQGERESRVDGSSAVPIAMLTTLVWSAYPLLGKYLVARFVKKNPYIIGYQCPIDTEQGRKRMGYRRAGDQWEGDSAYAERIGGITSVWAVITQSKINAKAGHEHPYPITHSWIFLSRQFNIPIESLYNANFAAVAAWWDVAGLRFLEAFGHQGTKLLELACTQWPAAVDGKTFAAAKRLKLLGQDWKKQGTIVLVWKPLGP